MHRNSETCFSSFATSTFEVEEEMGKRGEEERRGEKRREERGEEGRERGRGSMYGRKWP
jgi:hypothetical protein